MKTIGVARLRSRYMSRLRSSHVDWSVDIIVIPSIIGVPIIMIMRLTTVSMSIGIIGVIVIITVGRMGKSMSLAMHVTGIAIHFRPWVVILPLTALVLVTISPVRGTSAPVAIGRLVVVWMIVVVFFWCLSWCDSCPVSVVTISTIFVVTGDGIRT